MPVSSHRHCASRRRLFGLLGLAMLGAPAIAARTADLTVAAASDLRHALDEVLAPFRAAHPGRGIDVIYGASGKLATQIRHGAPFDVFLSADIAFPRALVDDGFAVGPVRRYGVGRLVLWSRDAALAATPLAELPRVAALRKFAIANPRHAPYGQRAAEALRHAGAWDALQGKLVLGENVAQTAQFVDSGAADAGLIALSIALAPGLAGRGHWTLVPADAHAPLEQGHVITTRGAAQPLAAAFVAHLDTPAAQALMRRYGFETGPAR